MALFDTGDREEDVYHTVRSACGMLKALTKFNEISEEKIEIRIGINSGNVILGNVGCESFRLDYTMIGDNVNIGQRLESMVAPMGCLISQSTCDLIPGFIEVGEAQSLSLKGKTTKVKAYPLIKFIPREGDTECTM